MRRKQCLSLAFLVMGMCYRCFAQTVSITGAVRDSVTGYTLSGVTVAAYSPGDSTLLDVQLTNNNGQFVLKTSTVDSVANVYVSFTGYRTWQFRVALDSDQTQVNAGTIFLIRNYKQLDEVLIKAAPPISMNGDTLEINPSAYKMPPGAVVEDMLKKVTGVVVWGDGTITVNGRKVDLVYVDGKPFISDDARVATQNLSKNSLEKIQVYTSKNRDLNSQPSDSLLTMNFELKENHKTGTLGKIGVGYGSSRRYDGGTTGIRYSKYTRVALAALANNVNKTISDIGSALRNNTYKNINPNLSDAPDFQMDGDNRSQFFGALLQHTIKPRKRLFLNHDIRAVFSHNHNQSMVDRKISETALVNSGERLSQSIATARMHSKETAGTISYTKRTSQTENIVSLNISSGVTNLEENNQTVQSIYGDSVSEGDMSTAWNKEQNKINLLGTYNNTDVKTLGLKSFHLEYEVSCYQVKNLKSIRNEFHAYVGNIPDRSVDRKYDIQNHTQAYGLHLLYPGIKRLLLRHRDITGLTISLNNSLRISHENSLQDVVEYDSIYKSFEPKVPLSYGNDLDSFQYKPVLAITKTFGKYLYGRVQRNLTLGMELGGNILTLNNSSGIADRNLDRSFAFFEPGISVKYNWENQKGQISLGYKGSIANKVPEIDQLFPVTDDINPYYIHYGNSLLKTEHSMLNTLDIGYKKIKWEMRNDFSTNLIVSYNRTRQAISDSLLIDEAGRRTVFPLNVPYRKNLTANLQANYALNRRSYELQIGYKLIMNSMTLPGFLNSTYRVSNYLIFNHEFSLIFSFSDQLTAELQEHIYHSRVTLSGNGGDIHQNKVFRTGLNVNYVPFRRIIFSNSFNYLSQPVQENTFLLWNIYLTYRFPANQQWEFKFSAFDLLRNYKNIQSDVGYNFSTTTINSSLKQFFMLSFSYFPRFL